MSDNGKKISIGMEDFKEIIDKNGYFVDKTLMIRDLIESNANVTLFTRPRRFGKTLNQSMIRRFFEDEITGSGVKTDNGYLFDGLAVSRCGEDILRHQQKYPVISISLKSAKQPDFNTAYGNICQEIADEFRRHQYVLESGRLDEDQKAVFRSIMSRNAKYEDYGRALKVLSESLAVCHGCKTIILIDEYDVPLENAYVQGFYDEMIGFIRSLFESVLKTNPHLEKGIITGCLRISRESIFTGLNNMEVHSILSPYCSEKFGFTESEVKDMLAYYDLSDKYPELKKWYDGYRFGKTEIYNPWSILNYVRFVKEDPDTLPKPYWSNTSSNSIVREMIDDADEDTRRELEILMDGGTIEKPVHEDITYGDIHENMDNFWNFLFFTGYLKAGKQRSDGENIYLEMSIPNTEVKTIYRQSIVTWFDKKIKATDRSPLIRALEEGDCETAEDFISTQLMDTISYFDYAESYYHGFMTGLLSGAGSYSVISNRECGTGRPDLVLKTTAIRKGRVIIIEFKLAGSIRQLDDKCNEALKQIADNRYAEPFVSEGYPVVRKYGISFYKKDCMVKNAE